MAAAVRGLSRGSKKIARAEDPRRRPELAVLFAQSCPACGNVSERQQPQTARSQRDSAPCVARMTPPEGRMAIHVQRRAFIGALGGAAAWPLVARGQTWPKQVVRIICPIAAGGGFDATARIVAAQLSQIWRQQVVVENKTGAGSNIAAEYVARSEPTATRSIWRVSRTPQIAIFIRRSHSIRSMTSPPSR